MRFLLKYIFFFMLFALTVMSCKRNEVDGILINSTLFENQSLESNQELRQLIQKTLKKDEIALDKLINFGCGGAAGCYDLGYIAIQIIYRMGEKEFVRMASKLEINSLNELEGLVEVGLEYGYSDKDRKMDYKNIEDEFPELSALIKEI